MKILSKALMIVSICQSLFFHELESCTRIFWNDNSQAKIVARTMDLFVSDEPQMWVNPRGIHHQSKVQENGLEWTSLYGNVSLSAFHEKNLTTDGLNEQGLAVHALVLIGTQYEKRDHRPGIHYGEWLQYLLGTCQTVEEAVNAHNNFQVVPITVKGLIWPLHLMIEDATGDSAIIEFIDGQMKVYHSPLYQVGANEPPYDKHLLNLANYEKFGGVKPLPTETDSMSRFVLASAYLKDLPEPNSLDEAIALTRQVMARVFQKDNPSKIGRGLKTSTLWTIIADLTHRTYTFSPTGRTQSIQVNFSELNFSEGAQVEELSLTNL